jgi:CBS domain-containing protein
MPPEVRPATLSQEPKEASMNVQDVMTTNVAAIGQGATLKQVAEVMADRGVSGVPVVNADGHVLGVVSEADIIVKAASRSVGLIGHFWTPAAVDDRRLAATTAGEAMTAPAVTIAPDRPITEAAWLMVQRNVNRLPVVRDGKLVGIISRGDLIRVFIRSDREIWEELQSELGGRDLWLAPEEVKFEVTGGRVRISGHVETPAAAELVEGVAWRVPGVVSVDCSEVNWRRTPASSRPAERR